MMNRQSLWNIFQNRNMSRRQFIKACGALTAILGLPPAALPEVIAKAEQKAVMPVIWLQGQGCSGCSASFLSSNSPTAAEALMNMLRMEYHELLSAASGPEIEQHSEEVMQAFSGNYIVVAEGAVPVAENGCFCSIGGIPYSEKLKKAAQNAAAVFAIGSCAAWGGIAASLPNPTQSLPVDQVLSTKTVIKIPGCPPIPEILAGVVLQFALFGKLPSLDPQGRPAQFFAKTIHNSCPRKPFFEAKKFAGRYDESGEKAGWCLYKLGCRGPATFNACASMRWHQGLSFPIQSGSPCIGCSNDDFGNDDLSNDG